MRLLATIVVGLVLFSGCSKEQDDYSDVQPESNNQTDQQVEKSNDNTGEKESPLNHSAKIKYEVKADGRIGNGQFKIDGESKSFCGGDEFSFTFETRQKQDLMLKALCRKNQVNKLKLRVFINGRLVQETSGESGKMFKKAQIQLKLDNDKLTNLK